MEYNWESEFSRKILRRGYEYYSDGAVNNLQFQKRTIKASVFGTHRYTVEIQLDRDYEINYMECTCPYAEDGNACKHMAAVLYEWSMEYGSFSEPEDLIGLDGNTEEAIDALLKEAQPEQMNKFIRGLLREDQNLYLEFRSLVRMETLSLRIQEYMDHITDLVDSADLSDCYNPPFEVMDRLDAYLSREVMLLISPGNAVSVMKILTCALTKTDEICCTGFSGDSVDVLERINALVENVWFNAYDSEQAEVFQMLEEMIPMLVSKEARESVYELLVDQFREDDYYLRKMKLLWDVANAAKASEYDEDSRNNTAQAVVRILKAMILAERPGKEIEQISRQYNDYPTVHSYYRQYLRDHREAEEDIEYLDEQIQRYTAFPFLQREYSRRKIELLKESDDSEALIQELKNMFLKYEPGGAEIFKELKKQFTAEQWEHERVELLEQVSKTADCLNLYVIEEMWDDLLDVILHKSGLESLVKYECYLLQSYADLILQKYEFELNRMMQKSRNRKKYHELALVLSHMRTLPEGKSKAEQILLEWRNTYGNRPALFEELAILDDPEYKDLLAMELIQIWQD